MKQYTDLIERILKEGHVSEDRTGTGTIKIFGHQSTYDMDDGFPLLTLKKTWMPGVTHELLWLLGCHMKDEKYKDLPMTNIKYLIDNKVHIWDEWADENGDLGPVYGKQWVDWDTYWHENGETKKGGNHCMGEGINQIQNVINKLTEGHKRFNPMDRGLIVSAWNSGNLDEMALRPCHALFQFQARKLTVKERMDISVNYGNINGLDANWDVEKGYLHKVCNDWGVPKYELSLQLYQRSADTFLGVPFNIASYSLLLHMICHVTGMKPGKFVHTFGDAHLYLNHKDQVNTILTRTYNFAPSGDIDVDNWDDDKILINNRDEIIDFYNLENKNWKIGPYMGPKLPKLWLNPDIKNIFDFTYDDIKIIDYKPLPTIKAPVSI